MTRDRTKLALSLFLILFFVASLIPFTTADGDSASASPGIPSTSSAQDRWIYNSDYLVLDVDMTIHAEKHITGPSPTIEQATAEITFFPKRNDLQQILSQQFTPVPTEQEDALLFRWEHPRDDNYDIQMKSVVKTLNRPMRITTPVPFPLQGELPAELIEYTQPAKIIDINRDIIKTASELAAGEEDMIVVVDKIAAWTTQNIKYDLSTVTAEATQQASCVLANKVGVCDELTSLFIAMLRSLGIPARFVSGISYTNSELFDEQWGPHGWAEVYFPGYGWIPYDVTYGEYGFVDPTHITSKVSLDAEKITTKYTWRGRDVQLTIDDFSTTVTIADRGKELSPYVSLDIELFKGSVNFGSYNFVKATVKNKGAFYQPLDIYLSKTEKLTVLDPHKQHVLLKPYEEKAVFWRLLVDPELEKDYIYTFPVSVYTLGEVSQKKEFKAVKGGIMISKARIDETIEELQKESQKTYDTTIALSCNADLPEYYEEETPVITCSITNKGNTFFKDLLLCTDDGADANTCTSLELGIQQQVTEELPVQEKELGLNAVILTLHHDQLSEDSLPPTSRVEFNVIDKPALRITKITNPERVSFSDDMNISFVVEKLSDSNPKQVVVQFKVGGATKEMTIDELAQSQEIYIHTKGSSLDEGENAITITATYSDNLGRQYRSAETGKIILDKITGRQKFYVLLRRFGDWIISLFG